MSESIQGETRYHTLSAIKKSTPSSALAANAINFKVLHSVKKCTIEVMDFPSLGSNPVSLEEISTCCASSIFVGEIRSIGMNVGNRVRYVGEEFFGIWMCRQVVQLLCGLVECSFSPFCL